LQKLASSEVVSKFFLFFRTKFEFTFHIFLLVLGGIVVVDALQLHAGLQLVDNLGLSVNY
jgi:hypothetical protein